MTPAITVSLVSHDHGEPITHLVTQLLADPCVAQVILTLNVPERSALPDDDRLTLIQNPTPLGFGQNHNQAFAHCQSDYFVVLNPDVGYTSGLFEALAACQAATGAAIVAPAVFDSLGQRQDSWRRFPTLTDLIKKALGHDPSIWLPAGDITYPDWVAGMCMLFDKKAFKALGGFDERFYLYYEDVDICARAWQLGWSVAGCEKAKLIHDGQRASHRQWQHFRWHVRSFVRYWRTHRALTRRWRGDQANGGGT
jgi:hypothetical protein